MIISIVGAKGGVGKSTTAMLLAFAFARLESYVTVLDCDKQGTVFEWACRISRDGGYVPFAVEIVPTPRRLQTWMRRVKPDEVVIVDTPPGDVQMMDSAIRVADVVVVPTRSYAADLSQMWRLLPALEDVEYRVLLTCVRRGTSSLAGAREVLDGEGVPRFSVEIPLREDIQGLFGLLPGKKLFGYDTVAQEIRKVVCNAN